MCSKPYFTEMCIKFISQKPYTIQMNFLVPSRAESQTQIHEYNLPSKRTEVVASG